MLRDMELCRKILLVIEEQYVDTAIFNLKVEGYSMKKIAYHCKLLYDAKLISDYKPMYGDDHLLSFGVGAITWEGHEYLDKIRQDTIWKEIKNKIQENSLPTTIEVVSKVAAHIISDKLSAIFQETTYTKTTLIENIRSLMKILNTMLIKKVLKFF